MSFRGSLSLLLDGSRSSDFANEFLTQVTGFLGFAVLALICRSARESLPNARSELTEHGQSEDEQEHEDFEPG
jgi:hypothetical protein